MTEHPFSIRREATDGHEFVAECDTEADGVYAMRHMLSGGEESGPLYLFGPGIQPPGIIGTRGKDGPVIQQWK